MQTLAAAQPVNWTDIAQALAATGGVLVALLGFVVLIYQIRQLRQTIQAESHGRIYQHALEVQRLFVEHPELRALFYNGEGIKVGHEKHDQLVALGELVADYLEHITLQRPNVPSDVQEAWDNYTRVMLTMSPVLRQVLSVERACYCRRFVELCDNILYRERAA